MWKNFGPFLPIRGDPYQKKKSDGIAAAVAGSLKIVCVNKYLKNI